MSHWRKYEVEVLKDVDQNLLEVALKDMGYRLDYNVRTVANSYGHATCNAAIAKADGQILSLGVVFNNIDGKTAVELVGDFFGTGISGSKFLDQLAQTYQKHNVVNKLTAHGWIVDEVSTTENGEIAVEAYCWAS